MADGAGVELVDELDGDGLQRVLGLDIDRADELRIAFARQYDRGNAELEQIEQFATHADNLEGVDGLNSGPVDDFVDAGAPGNAGDPGNVKVALREVRRADDIGSENIQLFFFKQKTAYEIKGELDIQLKSGKIIESKSSFGFKKVEVENQFERKLSTMWDHLDAKFDQNTLEVRASKVGDPEMVENETTEWENKITKSADWDNADATIEVVDESTSTVITG
ncbi:hypothetical protein Harman_41300 [Haloarcula mannanilytica]|uniref:Uncharacterized protein n=1 Tax=Haloarcula mannanilytica TaxID=2509225 RepID=A0A4C2EPE8_9EURY|nr:hypothetical protein [Haloarcula mannanilytica]GCF16195.1 hypothetical protein Harman_41300 [Haloarcula mannanilytica]